MTLTACRTAHSRCVGGIGTRFLFEAYQHLLHGRHPPEGFAASRNVLIFKWKAVDANGPLFRPPEARPRTLCNCVCKILTTAMPSELRKFSLECTNTSKKLRIKEDHDRHHFRNRDGSECPTELVQPTIAAFCSLISFVPFPVLTIRGSSACCSAATYQTDCAIFFKEIPKSLSPMSNTHALLVASS